MNVHDLIEKLDLTVINQGDLSRPVTGGYAGDLLSWVMGRAQQNDVWITIMSNLNTWPWPCWPTCPHHFGGGRRHG